MNRNFQCFEDDRFTCWESMTASALTRTLSTSHLETATSSIGIIIGLTGLIWSINNLYQRQRKIKYQQRVSMLERLWLNSSPR